MVLHQKALEIPFRQKMMKKLNILSKHENHPSVSKIKRNQNDTLNFEFLTAKVEDINKTIKRLGQMVFL